MNSAPTTPAALPLVALILGVLGFCIPPLFVLAIAGEVVPAGTLFHERDDLTD